MFPSSTFLRMTRRHKAIGLAASLSFTSTIGPKHLLFERRLAVLRVRPAEEHTKMDRKTRTLFFSMFFLNNELFQRTKFSLFVCFPLIWNTVSYRRYSLCRKFRIPSGTFRNDDFGWFFWKVPVGKRKPFRHLYIFVRRTDIIISYLHSYYWGLYLLIP